MEVIKLGTAKNNSTTVDAITSSWDTIFVGVANFTIFETAYIIKSIRKNIDADFAYFFSLGNFLLIPLASIPPWIKPIIITSE